MNTYNDEVQKLLNDTVTVNVYAGAKPEDTPFPALVHHNLGYQPSRVLSGVRLPTIVNYRIMIVARTDSDINLLLKQIEMLDNTENDDFQKIYLSLTYVEPRDLTVSFVRAMVNLDLHTR